MRQTRKTINNLSLRKNIIMWKAPIQSSIKHLCASCAQNGALEATLSHSAQAHSAYERPVRRMVRLKQHWVSACRPTALMSDPCAEWCAWSNTESRRAGPQRLWASRALNGALEATLSLGVQAHSDYECPVRRMVRLKQHWVSACRPTALMSVPCAEWCAWSNTESRRAGPQRLWASRAQNGALEATLSLGVQAQCSGVRTKKFKAQRKEILMRSVLNLCHSLLSLFF